MLGLIDRDASNRLTAFNLLGSFGFYLAVRTGLNLRIAPSDQSLTMPFSLFATVSVAWSYAITGPARGAVMSILILVVLFGVFQLGARQVMVVVLTGLFGLGVAMAWRVFGPPPRYDLRVELIHLVFATMITAFSALLAVRFGRLRVRLSAQKAELAKALEVNRQLASLDVLTGLINRREMVTLLARARQRRADTPVAIAILDLDHFKRINDERGHAAGDAVLQRFAEVARAGLRESDALARWGGEEFLLLMPRTATVDAQLVLRRLRERILAADFGAIGPGLQVTFSVGLAEFGEREGYEAVVDRADQALYRAKRNGRDRVESAEDMPVAV